MLVLGLVLAACTNFVKAGDNRHNKPLPAETVAALSAMGSSPGEAMLVRIFKQENTLEVWKRTSSGQFRMFKSYAICAFSGDLGPKIKEGDRQSPEGFYTITPGLMNPRSNYYLAFNTGFPNKFDRAWGRTGSNLMVHGDCKSVGCYAMTDASIAEIYALARESFRGGNSSFQLQIFPFRMTAANLAKYAGSQNLEFWKNIKEGYDLFELAKAPPVWDVCNRQYIFNPASAGPLDPLGPCPATVRIAGLEERQQADEAVLARSQTALDRQASEEAAIKARGAAMGSFFSNIGSVFTGGQEAPAAAPDQAPAASTSAPQPLPAPARS